MDKYNTLHHEASDTFDAVVQKDLAQGSAVIAIAAYAIADSPKRLRRTSRRLRREVWWRNSKGSPCMST
jgi:hypothetical protein